MSSSLTSSLGTRVAEFTDPYTYPGTTVLRNRFGIEDRDELAVAEYEASWIRREQIAEGAVTGKFDLAHLQAIHHWLFQDIFEWAGDLRTVNISKGTSRFLHAGSLQTGTQHTFEGVARSRLTGGPLTDDEFLDAAASLLGDINYLHPFREGNGRTQRAFLDQLAAHGGRELAWRNVTEEENITASATAVQDPNTPLLREMLARVLEPPLDGLRILDAGVYRVGSPTSVTGDGDEGGLGKLRSFPGN